MRWWCAKGLSMLAALALALPLSGQAQERSAVVVFAAASLKDALDEFAKAYGAGRGSRVVLSYAASSALARQIEHGAPADVFVSADRDWMDYLDGRGRLRAGTRVDLVSNRLVLIAPAGSKASLAIASGFPLAAALGDGRLAMADPDSVPAGKYGRAALQALGVWDAVARRAARAENVRAALALVARAESPLGIVYRSDSVAEPRVRVVAEFPPGLHPDIVYPAAVLSDSRSPGAAAFLRFLREPSSRAVWERHGFGVPEGR